ncbi:hypothetical protein LEN26_011179 [Aphanomyces euteiches]|nr:hypothetical protein AeMF1_012219 [Aphanomyces euteiches]KAH9120274.1 hypothetical protein LEN26_011179 [Aphanomyces euteiches]KAH9195162.1 hypothetical protein AeNC1_002855 [Aphanomyces euteiches]
MFGDGQDDRESKNAISMGQIAHRMASLSKAKVTFKRSAEIKVADKKTLRQHINQKRYRERQRNKVLRLHEDVAGLEIDVARLQGHLDSLVMLVPPPLRTFGPEVNIALEYFRVFGRGMSLHESDRLRILQHDFVHSSMRHDLVFMGSIGNEKVLAQGQLYASIFDSVHMDCQAWKIVAFDPEVMIDAQATLRLRLSRTSLQTLFPNVLCNEHLTQKLIGHVLELPVLCQFTYDRNFLVKKFDTIANPVAALMSLLHNIEDTSTVLSGSMLTENAEMPNNSSIYSL